MSIEEDQAQRILDLTKREVSYSAWLMFMYPRLLLARDLLKDDGVIFISIDDNANKETLSCFVMICFMKLILLHSWYGKRKRKVHNFASSVTNIKEYVLVYAKKKENFK